jgi:hypothetical protein
VILDFENARRSYDKEGETEKGKIEIWYGECGMKGSMNLDEGRGGT